MEAQVCCYCFTLFVFLLQWAVPGKSQVSWTPIYVDGNSKYMKHFLNDRDVAFIRISRSTFQHKGLCGP